MARDTGIIFYTLDQLVILKPPLKHRSLRVGKGGLPQPVFRQNKSGGKPAFPT